MIVRVTLIGVTPLMVHSQDGMNPLNPLAIELAGIIKKTKTPAIASQISDLEFQLSLYYDKEIGPYIPAANVRKMLHDGAKKSKGGPKFLEAVRTLPDCQKFPLLYDGERGMEWLLKQMHFRDVRNVRVGKAFVSRTRAIFHNWKLQGNFIINEEVLKLAEFKAAGKQAGEGVGLGEFTPKRSGEYGTFTFLVEEITSKAS